MSYKPRFGPRALIVSVSQATHHFGRDVMQEISIVAPRRGDDVIWVPSRLTGDDVRFLSVSAQVVRRYTATQPRFIWTYAELYAVVTKR